MLAKAKELMRSRKNNPRPSLPYSERHGRGLSGLFEIVLLISQYIPGL